MMRAARAHERHLLAELHHAFPLKHPGRPICAPAPGHSIAVQTDLAALWDMLTVSDVAAPGLAGRMVRDRAPWPPARLPFAPRLLPQLIPDSSGLRFHA